MITVVNTCSEKSSHQDHREKKGEHRKTWSNLHCKRLLCRCSLSRLGHRRVAPFHIRTVPGGGFIRLLCLN